MEEKLNKICCLLPPNCEEMLGQIENTVSYNTHANCAVKHLLKQCCSLFYSKKMEKLHEVSEQIHDYSWELLNTGHWKDVAEINRVFYSFSLLFKLLSIAEMNQEDENSSKELIRLCDKALLMGAPILNGIFYKIVDIMNPSSQKRKVVDNYQNMKKKKLTNSSVSNTRIRKQNSIPILVNPSLEVFKIYMKKEEPVVLEGCCDHWPAFKYWSVGYLQQIAGHRTVPVEIGSRYTDDTWGQKLMTISDFIDDHIINCQQSSSKGYLAQHQLFDQIPELKADIYIPDYCCLSTASDEEVDINAWIGPAGTVSPCHFDPKHNLFTQVVGRKYVRLYHPKYSRQLYPFDGASILTNTSQVDVENPDFSKFPLFQEVDSLHCQEHLLLPGQMLYIPAKHWHYIRSLDVSFSVSFWWQ